MQFYCMKTASSKRRNRKEKNFFHDIYVPILRFRATSQVICDHRFYFDSDSKENLLSNGIYYGHFWKLQFSPIMGAGERGHAHIWAFSGQAQLASRWFSKILCSTSFHAKLVISITKIGNSI